MRGSDRHLEQGLAVFTGASSGRDHLAGLRRGVLFLFAVAGSIFLFTSVGLRSADTTRGASSRSWSSRCAVGAYSCVAFDDSRVALYQ